MWEGKRRKAKTGHAFPVQAMEDEDNSEMSAAAHERLRQVNEFQEKGDAAREVSLHEHIKV
jgi:hypothetical protein